MTEPEVAAPEFASAPDLDVAVNDAVDPAVVIDGEAMSGEQFHAAAAAALWGIDYSYGSGLTTGQMRAAGVHFAARYLAPLPNSKCINATEFHNLVRAGISVVFVWEGSGRDGLRGNAGGVTDARQADAQARGMGAAGAVIYFAPADYDVPPGDQAAINSYMTGAASVIGHARTGMYGGYWPLKRAFDAKVISYGWQTYAWSGGNWDARAHLQQYQNDMHLGPASVDYDRAVKLPDYGQWPRPKAPAPAPSPAPAPGVRRLVTAGQTWGEIAKAHGKPVVHIIGVSVDKYTAADWKQIELAHTSGAPIYVEH